MGNPTMRLRGKPGLQGVSRLSMHLASLGFLLICSVAGAFEIKTGNEDIRLHWDNTLRYNYGYRTDARDPKIISNPNFDDGDRNFGPGNVSNRLDILSELDLVYKKLYGFRVSGAGWYDHAYRDVKNNSVATSNHLENGKPAKGLSDFADRYFHGPNGELLDAFVFGGFELGRVPVKFRVGQHSIFWGEGLLTGGLFHGVAYSQMPLDLAKGFAVPGTEAKELFRPINNISIEIQPATTFSLAAQYFFDWKAVRAPEAGTYLGAVDFFLQGGESLIAEPGARLVHGDDSEPSGRKNWGVRARWTPEWLGGGGAVGVYYRKFADILPQVHVQPGVFPVPDSAICGALGLVALDPTTCFDPKVVGPVDLGNGIIGNYRFAYGDDIDLYGVSFARSILGTSVGAEVSYRRNMPLTSGATTILPQALAPSVPGSITVIPEGGDTGGARGNTLHALVNSMALWGKGPFGLWDSSVAIAELSYSRWLKVTENEDVFLGRSGYHGIDRVTRNCLIADVKFTPTWLQVFPSTDLSLPMSYSRGLWGNSPVQFGGNKGTGSWSVGVGAVLYGVYNFDLLYTDYFGSIQDGTPNGLGALLRDRGTLSFTFKTTL